MTQTTRLSYSQIRLYSECGKKYEYYYKKKLREKTKSGALFFGSAMDKALEYTLIHPDKDEYEVFDAMWSHQEINGKRIYLPDSLLVNYAATDFDSDLLNEEDMAFLQAKKVELLPDEGGDVLETYKACINYKKQRAFRRMKDNEVRFLNLCNWFSLRRKGHLMLKAHREKVVPMYQHVYGTQIKVELANGSGDTLLGFVDLKVKWADGTDVVLDYKTSASEYDEDSVLTSPQLAIYAHALNTRRAGFVVFVKAIDKNKVKMCPKCGFNGTGSRAKSCTNEVDGKRCSTEWIETIKPEAKVQILINDIPERTEEIVLDNIETINRAIKANIFSRNLNACKIGNSFCPYVKMCYKNSDEDLEKVE